MKQSNASQQHIDAHIDKVQDEEVVLVIREQYHKSANKKAVLATAMGICMLKGFNNMQGIL